MVTLLKIRFYFLFILILPAIIIYSFPNNSQEELEKAIGKAIKSEISCKEIKVKIIQSQNNSSKINNMAVRMDGVNIGGITADFITIQYSSPVLDNQALNKKGKLKLLSHSGQKVNILLSVGCLQNYLLLKAKELGKNNVNIRLKYSPPFIECFYDVPKKEIASETAEIIS